MEKCFQIFRYRLIHKKLQDTYLRVMSGFRLVSLNHGGKSSFKIIVEFSSYWQTISGYRKQKKYRFRTEFWIQ